MILINTLKVNKVRGNFMDIKNFIKQNKIPIALIFIVSCVFGALASRKSGIKDGGMFGLAVLFLLIEIYMLFIDKRKSMLLFIVSFPVLVTARKFCYFYSFITFESIYITIVLLILNKKVIDFIKANFYNFKFTITYALVFAVLALNSSFYSSNIGASILDGYLAVIVPILFMLEVMILFKDDNNLDKIINSLIIGLDLSCLYGFFQAAATRMSLSELRANRQLLTFGYNNVNIFAGVLIVIMPFIFEKILYKKMARAEKIITYFSALVTIATLVLTFTRGAIICFLISIFILMLDKKYRKFLYIAIVILPFVIKKAAVYILSRGSSQLTSMFMNESFMARVQSIFTSVKIILKYPFGIGQGNFLSAYKEFAMQGYLSIPGTIRDNSLAANYSLEMAHNLFLQIAVDLGIITCIVFIILIIRNFIVSIKLYKVNRAMPTVYIIYIIFVITTGSEFNHKGIITGTLIIWLLFGITDLMYLKRGKENESAD